MTDYTIPIDTAIILYARFVNAHGAPIPLTGNIVWTAASPNLVSLKVDPNNSAYCTVTPVAVGNVNIRANAMSPLQSGTIQASFNLVIIPLDQVSATILFVGEEGVSHGTGQQRLFMAPSYAQTNQPQPEVSSPEGSGTSSGETTHPGNGSSSRLDANPGDD